MIFQLVYWLLGMMGFGPSSHAPMSMLALHPIAIAAWIGMLATALNLMPGGQLDGGHMLFALNARWHHKITRLAIFALIPMAYFIWSGWMVWALGLWLMRRHPPVPEWPEPPPSRRALAWLALAMFVLTLVPRPFGASSMHEMVVYWMTGQ